MNSVEFGVPMFPGFLLILSSAFTLIGLNGLFTILKNTIRVSKDPLPSGSEIEPVPGIQRKEFPTLDLKSGYAVAEQFLVVLAAPSWEGLLSFALIIVITIISAFILLFIDLPLLAMISLGFVTLAAAAVSVSTIIQRRANETWLPSGKRIKSDEVPLPDIPADFIPTHESPEYPDKTDLPGESSLA